MGQNTFEKIYGDIATYRTSAHEILATSDGYVMIGNGTGTRPELMKITPDGQMLWHKTYGDGNAEIYFNKIVKANDSGFLITGLSYLNSPGDLFLIKTDDNGVQQWQKLLTSVQTGVAYSGETILPVNDGYIISGQQGKSIYTRALLMRLNNQGDILWSKVYGSGKFGEYTKRNATVVSGDTLFAFGSTDSISAFSMFSLSTGNLMYTQGLSSPEVQHFTVTHFMTEASNGDFILSETGKTGTGPVLWVCRLGRTGEVKWAKTYQTEGVLARLRPLSDGNFLILHLANKNPGLVKIDGNGNIIWAYNYGSPATFAQLYDAIETPDKGIISIGYIQVGNQFHSNIWVLKTDPVGLIESCCNQPLALVATEYPMETYTESLNLYTPENLKDVAPLSEKDDSPSAQDFCPFVAPVLENVPVFLCPGDSVVINGISYTQPGLVSVSTHHSNCDTLINYHIDYATQGGSTVSVQCPADITVETTSGSATPVQYSDPVFTTDCACNHIETIQTQGLASGSAFGAGTHTICFEGKDDCGSIQTCCFYINVQNSTTEQPCDTKQYGCLKYELLGIKKDALSQKIYRIRFSNQCSNELVYAAIQVPDGVSAIEPLQNQVYTAPSGRTYTVRNPNASPFYSIRFSALGDGINNGASDVFEYKLPAQADPLFIHVAARLEQLGLFESYLNVFNCPVEPVSTTARSGQNQQEGIDVRDVLIYPNPARNTLHVDWGGGTGFASATLVNALGIPVAEYQLPSAETSVTLELPENVCAGMYILKLCSVTGAKKAVAVLVNP